MATPTAGGLPFLGVRAGLAIGGFGPARVAYTLPEVLICDSGGIAMGDFDGNGRTDVALTCGSFLRVLLQDAAGNFASERTSGYNGGGALTALDLDGDSKAELAFVGTPPGADVGSSPAWFVISRSTAGLWSARSTVALGAISIAAFIADIDGDGRADLAWHRVSGTGQHEIAWAPRQGSGFGAVQSQPIVAVSGAVYAAAMGDIDGDGLPDLVYTVATNDGPKLLLLRGLGVGKFAAAAEVFTAGYDPYGDRKSVV